jgi:uncharacterized membrane protein YkvA (DUF1232 family)
MAGTSFKVSFTLDEHDANYFRRLFRSAKRASKDLDREEVLSAATDLVERVRKTKNTPKFVVEAMLAIEDLTQIITDPDYRPPATVVNDVLGALAYFANPDDLIPDNIPVLGFLDDAIMIKFVEEEFKHELKAFRKFRRFRDGAEQRPWTSTARGRLPGRLDAQRAKLREEVNNKKKSDADKSKTGF